MFFFETHFKKWVCGGGFCLLENVNFSKSVNNFFPPFFWSFCLKKNQSIIICFNVLFPFFFTFLFCFVTIFFVWNRFLCSFFDYLFSHTYTVCFWSFFITEFCCKVKLLMFCFFCFDCLLGNVASLLFVCLVFLKIRYVCQFLIVCVLFCCWDFWTM